jgi:hypothetical protein
MTCLILNVTGRGERGQAVIVVNLLYPNWPLYTYAVSDNGEGEISLIETLYNSPLLLDLISTNPATNFFTYWEKNHEIQ